MTLNISLSPESEAKLRERAGAAGKDVSAFVREAIEEKLAAGGGEWLGTGVVASGNAGVVRGIQRVDCKPPAPKLSRR